MRRMLLNCLPLTDKKKLNPIYALLFIYKTFIKIQTDTLTVALRYGYLRAITFYYND